MAELRQKFFLRNVQGTFAGIPNAIVAERIIGLDAMPTQLALTCVIFSATSTNGVVDFWGPSNDALCGRIIELRVDTMTG